MARTLYRIYLYLVCIVMLVFAAISLGALLNTLLLETPLRGIYEGAPDSRTVVQNSVLASIALLVTVGIAGVHYWLIRRDMAGDASAGSGGVRSLALNLVQGAAALVAFFAGTALLSSIGIQFYSGSTLELAAVLTAALVLALAQWERARTRAAPGAALVFERLHLYGVQVVILLAGIGMVIHAVETSINVVLVRAHAIPAPCADVPRPFDNPGCDPAAGLLGAWLAVAWVAGAWALYAWLARADRSSVLRQVAQVVGFLVGLGSLVYGVYRAAEWLLRAGLGVSAGLAVEYMQSYAFVGAVLFGTAVALLYMSRLSGDSAETALGPVGTQLMLLALAAVGLGIPFYLGIMRLGAGLVDLVFTGNRASAADLAAALALIFAGVLHPLLAYLLRVRSTEDAPIGPRSAYVLGGLAAGGLTAGISLVFVLYVYVTALLGSPVGGDWQTSARDTLVVMLVGAFIGGIHLWRLLARPALLRGVLPGGDHAAPGAGTGAGAAGGGEIEVVLDELLAGHVTRDQAAAQLRALIQAPVGR